MFVRSVGHLVGASSHLTLFGRAVLTCTTRRAQYTNYGIYRKNTEGFWSQEPLRVWFLGPETFNIRYLDPLGDVGILNML